MSLLSQAQKARYLILLQLGGARCTMSGFAADEYNDIGCVSPDVTAGEGAASALARIPFEPLAAPAEPALPVARGPMEG